MQIEEILNRLQNVKQSSANSWQALCPAHDDQNPSLSVKATEDRILLKCFAGCTTEEICHSFGIDLQDLFYESNHKDDIREKIRRILKKVQPAPEDFQYLVTKQIKPYNLKEYKNSLVIPIYQPSGKISSLQFIDPAGKKTFLKGGKTKNGYFPIGEIQDRLFIAEGIATGFTIHEVTGESVAIAFNCGNLLPVAESLKNKYPDIEIIIAGDNDTRTENNPGKTKAIATAQAIQGRYTIPDIDGDFNDVFVEDGKAETLRQLRNVQHPASDLIGLETVQAKQIDWIWNPYIPRQALTLLAGNPGEGKSTLSLALAASISTGSGFPEGMIQTPENVLLLTAEDSLEHTVKPRLESMNADLTKVKALNMVTGEDGHKAPLNLQQHFTHLENYIDQIQPALVVIDPIQGFIGGGVDVYRVNEVRSVLAPLNQLAEQFNTAFLIIQHLTKSNANKAIYRGLGSVDFVAAVRSMLLLGETEDEQKALTHIKSNLSAKGQSIEFSIDQGAFRWGEFSNIEAPDLLMGDNGISATAREEAEYFLIEVLQSGPRRAKKIGEEAEELGISKRTLRRAKKNLNIQAKRISEGNDGSGYWVWFISQDAQDAHIRGNGHLADENTTKAQEKQQLGKMPTDSQGDQDDISWMEL